MSNTMDKFEKMSIYSIDWKSIDNDGNEQVFTFKPLPFQYYPKTYDLINKLKDLKVDESLSEEEAGEEIMGRLNSSIVSQLVDLEKVMVSTSYPDLSEEKVELFVMSNAFNLMDPLLQLINRQETIAPRQAEAAKNDLV